MSLEGVVDINTFSGVILIDFDGTFVTHEYPNIGSDYGMLELARRLVYNNHELVLWTVRTGKELLHAKEYLKDNFVEFTSYDEFYERQKEQHGFDGPKPVFTMIIDDRAAGVPIMYPDGGPAPVVDAKVLEAILEEDGWFSLEKELDDEKYGEYQDDEAY